MKNYILTSIITFFLSLNLSAQKEVTLNINHKLDGNTFSFSQESENDMQHKFKISRVDYYMSKFTIIHDGGMETVVPDGKYILAKGSSNVSESLGTFNVTNVEGIKFYIGVDTPVNNADPSLQTFGPLAPQSPSMHWGWASGYRFVAIEGKAGASLNTTFEMHGLFNANYFEQTVMVTGVDDGMGISINLDADYKEALKGIDLSSGPIDHGVDATDLTVLQNFRDNVFKASSSSPALSSEKDILTFSVSDMIGSANIGTNTIDATVSSSADITSLAPSITVSADATISPDPSVAQDFSSPVNYTITAEDNSTKTYKVTISQEQSASINSLRVNEIELYPNPSNGIVRIKKNNSTKFESIQVFDELGKMIQKMDPNIESEINLTGYSKGVYFIEINSSEGTESQRMIIE